MANTKQVTLLEASSKENNGCKSWNEFIEAKAPSSYMIVTEQIDLSGAYLGNLNLSGAFLYGADVSGANFSFTNLSNVNLSSAKLYSKHNGSIYLFEAQTEQTNLSNIDWEGVPWLGDEFPYPSSLQPRGRLYIIGWTQPYGHHLVSARTYQRLVKNLRAQNLNDEADKFAYRAKICQRRMHFRKILTWPSHLGQYLFSHILNLVAGYGYKPERTLFWYLATVFGFMFLYLQISQGWAPFGLTTPTSLQPHLQWYEALILSVSSFHGRGFFQPVNSLGDPVAAIAAIEAVVGLFIEVSLIATFTQRFFGK